MIPIHVALVAYGYEEPDEYVNPSMILRVAAALQVQLTRDFTPIWGIPAVVSAFLSLEEVPPGSIPLVVVKPGSLQPRAHAFHVTQNGQPIGLVGGGDGWSLAASHELLEIVCDPQGTTKVMGESLADHADPKDIIQGAEDYPRPQGQVAYLLEICDPCQLSHYTLNGFQVSDFVTPTYYSPGAAEGGRHSFTGKIRKPRQILPGGYITWYTWMQEAPIWQAIRDTSDNLRIGPLSVPVAAYSRYDLDYFNDFVSGLEASLPPGVSAARAEDLAKASARRYGEELSNDVRRLLEMYKPEHPAVPLADLLRILEKLAYDRTYRSRFEMNPNDLFSADDVKKLLGGGLDVEYPSGKLPSEEQFRAVYEPLKKLSDRQANLTVSGQVATTMMLGPISGGPPPPPPPPWR